MVSLSVWAWVLPPDSAGPLVVMCSLLGQVLNGRLTWAGLRMARAWPFILGGALGIPLGAWLLPQLDAARFRMGLGLFLILWCATMLLTRARRPVAFGGSAADGLAGWIGGVMGGLGGLSGPVPTLWATLRGWEKDAQRAVFQAFNTAMHALALTAFVGRGLVGGAELSLFAVAAPAMLLPLWLGTRVYARLGALDYRRVVVALLLVAGLGLVIGAIPKPG
jgi:uncharacterized membrane protein YfcA